MDVHGALSWSARDQVARDRVEDSLIKDSLLWCGGVNSDILDKTRISESVGFYPGIFQFTQLYFAPPLSPSS